MARSEKKTSSARIVDVEIARIGARGDGIGIVDEKTVFVPYTAPGDLVKVDLKDDRGAPLDLLRAGPARASPSCKLFGWCGGCAVQHLSTDAYADWKRGLVVDALAAAGFDDVDVAPLIDVPAASRRRAQFYVERQPAGAEMLVKMGYYERRSRRLIDVRQCPILAPKLNGAIEGVRGVAAVAPKDWGPFFVQATACKNGLDLNISARSPLSEPGVNDVAALMDAARAAGAVRLSVDGEPVVAFEAPRIAFEGVAVSPPPGGFLQSSAEGEAELLKLVRGACGAPRKVVDLFSGSGAFALPLAKETSVVAYDADRASIAALMAGAAGAQSAGANITPPQAFVRDLFERPLAVEELNAFDAIVIDPPRAGAPAQMREIAKSSVRVVASVSCNPKSFARDARFLVDRGYRLTQVTPVDQFVYSSHVELVAAFERD